MDKRIIQIIPAPANLMALYEDSENDDTAISANVICLALVEYRDGARAVEGMTIDSTYIGTTDEDNFIGLHYEKEA